jgi:hypothetical protein
MECFKLPVEQLKSVLTEWVHHYGIGNMNSMGNSFIDDPAAWDPRCTKTVLVWIVEDMDLDNWLDSSSELYDELTALMKSLGYWWDWYDKVSMLIYKDDRTIDIESLYEDYGDPGKPIAN